MKKRLKLVKRLIKDFVNEFGYDSNGNKRFWVDDLISTADPDLIWIDYNAAGLSELIRDDLESAGLLDKAAFRLAEIEVLTPHRSAP